MKRFFTRHRTGMLLFAALGCLFIILYRRVGLYYAINDDTTMQKLASGANTGVPDGHLIFVKYALGTVIAWMFSYFPQYDWYGLIMLGFLFLSCFLIARRIFLSTEKKENCWLMRAAGGVLFLFMIIDTVILFQFTVVAGVLAAAALFCLIASGKEIRVWEYALVWILLLCSCLVRLKVFYMGAAAAVVITGVKLIANLQEDGQWPRTKEVWKNRFRKTLPVLIRAMVIVLAAAVLFCGIQYAEKKAYSEEKWAKYMEYKHYRSLIMDYYGWPEYQGNEVFWESLGISQEEHACIRLYGILPNIDADTIIAIAKYAEKQENDSGAKSVSGMWDALRTAATMKRCRFLNILMAATVLTFLLRIIFAGRNTRILLLPVILVEGMLLLYLLYGGRLPSRIVQIFDYQCIFVMLGAIIWMDEGMTRGGKTTKRAGAAALCLVSAVLLCLSFFGTGNLVKDYEERLQLFKKQTEYVRANPDAFYVTPTGTMATTKQFTLHEEHAEILNTTGTYGWSLYSPWDEKKYEYFGLSRTEHILLQPNVFMLTSSLNYADLLNRFYLSEGLISRDYEIVSTDKFPTGITLYTVQWNSTDS